MSKNINFRVVILLISFLLLFSLSCQKSKNEDVEQNEIHLLLNRHPFTESILRFLPEFEKETNHVRRGKVGEADSMLMPQAPLVDYATQWMSKNRK